VHGPSEEKSDNAKDIFMRNQSKCLFIILGMIQKFYHEIIMQKWGERIFSNQQFGNEGLNQGSNGNGIRTANTAISKYLVVKSKMFLHQNIHKYT
jgi:hypothetical protein